MKQNTRVVDLHIEKLAAGYKKFSPEDSFIYQKETFERTLQTNRYNKGMKIDFIHGHGEGTLRTELIKILQQKFPTYTYEDAPFNIYGYQGALRVTII